MLQLLLQVLMLLLLRLWPHLVKIASAYLKLLQLLLLLPSVPGSRIAASVWGQRFRPFC